MKKGFTLAEVLLTLITVGIVAILTIPQLMINTNDQQTKTPKKKAVSILSQAVELFQSREIQCKIYSHATLTDCISNTLAGTRTNGTLANVSNRITSNDGIVYEFYYRGSATDAASALTLEEACGNSLGTYSNPATTGQIDGTNAKCIVLADVNGLGKGSTEFIAPPTIGTAFSDDYINGKDQAVFELTATGTRPVAWNEGKYGIEAWELIYGSNPYKAK